MQLLALRKKLKEGISDLKKMKGASPEDQALLSGADVGFISQNVYLFCASEGLSTLVRD